MWDIVPVLVVLDTSILNAFTIESQESEQFNELEWQLLPSQNIQDEEMNSHETDFRRDPYNPRTIPIAINDYPNLSSLQSKLIYYCFLTIFG